MIYFYLFKQYYERHCSKLPMQPSNQPLNGTQQSNSLPGPTGSPPYGTHTEPTTEANRNQLQPHLMPDGINSANPSTAKPTFGPHTGGSVNKEIVIMNGTVGGILTTRITRFPESLLPTLSPQGICDTRKNVTSLYFLHSYDFQWKWT